MVQREVRRGVTRRGVIKAGLIGTGVTLLGGLGLALRPSRLVPAEGLHVLGAKQYSVLAAVADRICPAAGEGAPGARALDVARQIDGRLRDLEPATQAAIGMLLDVFESALTGAIFGERLAPFTQLDAEAQDRVLAQWRASEAAFRRTAFGALNSLISSTYYGDSRTWTRLGYPGPPEAKALRIGFAMNLVDYDALRASRKQ